jgi:hypothetical protein
MKDFVIKRLSISHIHRRLDDGIFALPRLQREFVWNGRKAAVLLDSIYRGMPIGTISVWNTARGRQNLLRKTLHILPPYSNANDEIWFLIDGQQRLSVLHQSILGNVYVPAFGLCLKKSDGNRLDICPIQIYHFRVLPPTRNFPTLITRGFHKQESDGNI